MDSPRQDARELDTEPPVYEDGTSLSETEIDKLLDMINLLLPSDR